MVRSRELEEQILERVAEGRSLRDVLGTGRSPGFPSRSSFASWVRRSAEALGSGDDRDDLAVRYAVACEQRAETIADEVIEIADGRDCVEGLDDYAQIQRDRLRVDARKWFASKLSGKYANRLRVDAGEGIAMTFAEIARLADESDE